MEIKVTTTTETKIVSCNNLDDWNTFKFVHSKISKGTLKAGMIVSGKGFSSDIEHILNQFIDRNISDFEVLKEIDAALKPLGLHTVTVGPEDHQLHFLDLVPPQIEDISLEQLTKLEKETHGVLASNELEQNQKEVLNNFLNEINEHIHNKYSQNPQVLYALDKEKNELNKIQESKDSSNSNNQKQIVMSNKNVDQELVNKFLKDKKPYSNLQYVRGNVFNFEDKGEYATFSVKIQEDRIKDAESGISIPNIESTFINVFAKGKTLDKLKADGISNKSFVEVSGKSEFKNYKDSKELNNSSNTLYASSIVSHEFEKGVKLDFKFRYPNKLQLKGNLVSSPDVLVVKDDQLMVKLNLATNETYKDKQDNWQETVKYSEAVLFGQAAADAIQSEFGKGDPVILSGMVNNNVYQDAENDTKRYSSNMVATDMKIDLAQFKSRLNKNEKNVAVEAEKKNDNNNGRGMN
jgi:single-strand DNA-binding protein